MKKIDSLLVKALQAVWSVALIAVLILTSVDLNCFSRPFYADQYRQLNTAQTIGMSEEDLDLTTDVLLDYTQASAGIWTCRLSSTARCRRFSISGKKTTWSTFRHSISTR